MPPVDDEPPDEEAPLEVDPPDVEPPDVEEVVPPEVEEVEPPDVDPPKDDDPPEVEEVDPPDVDEVDPPEVEPPDVEPPDVEPPDVVPPDVEDDDPPPPGWPQPGPWTWPLGAHQPLPPPLLYVALAGTATAKMEAEAKTVIVRNFITQTPVSRLRYATNATAHTITWIAQLVEQNACQFVSDGTFGASHWLMFGEAPWLM